MFGLAVIIALIVAGVTMLLDFVPISSNDSTSKAIGGTIVTTLVAFVVLVLFNWLLLYKGTPTFSGISWAGLFVMNLIIPIILFLVKDYIIDRTSMSWPALAVGGTLFFIVVGFWNQWPLQGQSNKLGHLAAITKEAPTAYPPTDDNHMVVVSDQNAVNKADQAMGQFVPGSSTTIGSLYNLGSCELQSVSGHMYYICALGLSGSANSRSAKYVVPGYVVVDAEDPNVVPQTRLTYHMNYTSGAPYGHSLKRLIYTHGYRSYFIDDLTLEVDDQWNPYYTASINRPGVRWQTAIPKGFITIDPQTGHIQRYALNQVPSWVDRVYSATMAKDYLNWWGEWGVKSWSVQGSSGRFKVDGDVTLVYTTTGPAWQALMTSLHSDASINYVALMDTRSNKVSLYPAPKGLTTQNTVTRAISTSKSNLKSLDPVNMALHQIYGQLTWVAPLVPNGSAGKGAESSAGLALLNATDPNSADVIIGTDKGDALSQYSAQIATGTNNGAPEANSRSKSVTGTISAVNQVVIGGNTFVVLTLKDDTTHLYRGQVTADDFSHLAMGLAHTGDTVNITYIDTNSQVRNISAFTDTTLAPSS